MSFIEVMLSRREVVLSLALVALVLFVALLLAVLPVLRKRMKRMQAQRKARKAAKIAQLKKKKAAAKVAYQKRQAEEAAGEENLLEGIEPAPEIQPGEAVVATAPVVTMQAAPAPAPAPAATMTASPITPSTTTAAPADAAAGTPAPFHPEEQTEEEEAESDLQSILDDVFVDDEANARYEVLLRDVEIMTADELVEMATRLTADLRARKNGPSSSSSSGAA